MLAYAFILTHEGYPCVFWQDYYTWNLGEDGLASGIAALVRVHEDYAGGPTSVLHLRMIFTLCSVAAMSNKKDLIFVLNTREEWRGAWVQTQWRNTTLVPLAWRGKNDAGIPPKETDPTRRVDRRVGSAPRLCHVCSTRSVISDYPKNLLNSQQRNSWE